MGDYLPDALKTYARTRSPYAPMPTVYRFSPDMLQSAAESVFRSAGSPEAEAALVAGRLVKSNLTGHDSHGVIRIPRYLGWVRDGTIRPGARTGFLRDNGSTAVLTGNRGYGQVAADEAMRVAVARAREHHVVAIGVTDLTHIGRLADYAVTAAEAGMIALVFTSTGGYSRIVAPFGGEERRMSTNPMAVAFPSRRDSGRESPVVFDFASSAFAEGKFRVFADAAVPAPEGVLIDSEGRPTTDAEDLYRGGAILPLGGRQGHKGYLLNFLMEVLGGLLTGGGFVGKEEAPPFNNCTMMIVLNVAAFRGLPAFTSELEQLIAHLKATRPAEDGKGGTEGEVLYPGELEARMETKRRAEGIPLARATVEKIQAELDHYGVETNLMTHGRPSDEPVWNYG